MASDEDQRNYYRIDDDIILEYKTVDKHQVQLGNPAALFPDQANLQLLNEFKKLGRELKKLDLDSTPTVQAALKLHDRRLDLLANYIFMLGRADQSITPVSLSEGGIAFLMEKAPYKGSQIALSMTFLSSGYSIFAFSEVLRTEPKTQNYLVAVKFIQLAATDKATIARHIIASQRKPSAAIKG